MGRLTNHRKRYMNSGRPTKFTPEVLNKLEQGFMYSFSDEEACLYAGVSPKALYNYQKKNPDFVQRKQLLKLSPNLLAKEKLVKDIRTDINQARWWAERRMKGEFSLEAQKLEIVDNNPKTSPTQNIYIKEMVLNFDTQLKKKIAEVHGLEPI